jgi:hypothetical protein
MGGTNDEDNLVELTAREHFICHKLLTCIYPSNNKLWYALWAMTVLKGKHQYRYITSNRIYESIRIEVSKRRSADQLGKKMSEECILKRKISKQHYKHSDLTKHKISIANAGKVRSEEFKLNLSKMYKGKQAHNAGLKTPDCIKSKISKTMKQKKLTPWNKGISTKTLICPHCSKSVDPGNAKQWHFNNCKFFVDKLD